MMAAKTPTPRLIDRLPPVQGRYSENAPLDRITWFRVGGPAEVMFRPKDSEDLAGFLAARPEDVPVTVVGVGSNLLVRDGGVPGVVVRLGRSFATVRADGTRITAGASALDINVAIAARAAGIAGFEFLSGIPGTIGGALRMNAGAYGREMKDVIRVVTAIDPSGSLHRLTPDDMGFAYRHCGVASDWIFAEAEMEGEAGEETAIAGRMAEIREAREATQPVRTPTGGSTFANPAGAKAWELIDRAGCRGLVRGGAMVSEKHCNFLVNTGGASAADLESLGEEVRRRVKETSGVTLEWEIRRIGVSLAPGLEEVTS